MTGPTGNSRSHDRREGGRWSYGQALKNHALYGAARCALFGLRPFSLGALRSLGRCLGQLVYLLGCSPRRITLENLALAYPDLSPAERDALARRVYTRLGGYLGEAVAQVQRPSQLAPLPFEDGSRDVLEAAMKEGRGVLFASAHLGPWERVASSLVHHGFPLVTLARESYDLRFAPLYEQLRGQSGVRAIYRGSPTAPLQIVRTLRHGGLLGAPMDLRSRVPSIDVPFLGIPASTPIGPARIALRTRAAVVIGTAYPAGDPETINLRVTRVPTDDLAPGDAGEAVLTGRLNDEIASRIRAFPEGWVWMHPRWATDSPTNSAPLSEESRYSSARVVEELR